MVTIQLLLHAHIQYTAYMYMYMYQLAVRALHNAFISYNTKGTSQHVHVLIQCDHHYYTTKYKEIQSDK